jgi:hypothetical protein
LDMVRSIDLRWAASRLSLPFLRWCLIAVAPGREP